MRKHSKFITILLSALLAVCLVQTVFVQAFATENSATPDEVSKNLKPVSMKIIKAPESAEVVNGEVTDKNFWSKVVVKVTYNNGESFDVNCKNLDDGRFNDITPPYPEIKGYEGTISGYYSVVNGKVSITLYYDYAYNAYALENSYLYAYYDIKNVKFDPESNKEMVVSCEITKLPDKVFTAPLFTKAVPRDDDSHYNWYMSLDKNNSIANNMIGTEFVLTYLNGTKKTFKVTEDTEIMNSVSGTDFVMYYWTYKSTQINDNRWTYLEVTDLGNYKADVNVVATGFEQTVTITAKSVSNPNPPLPNSGKINGNSTIDTPTKPSGNISSATSDVATKDNAGNNNTTNGTANNGVVATGDFATPAIIATVMILAAAVMFVLKRKHTF